MATLFIQPFLTLFLLLRF